MNQIDLIQLQTDGQGRIAARGCDGDVFVQQKGWCSIGREGKRVVVVDEGRGQQAGCIVYKVYCLRGGG